MLALASLSIDSMESFLPYYLEAAQLGSPVARSVLSRSGPEIFEGGANAPAVLQFNLWALETNMSPMSGMEKFLTRLENTCPSILDSDEIRIELMENRSGVHGFYDL